MMSPENVPTVFSWNPLLLLIPLPAYQNAYLILMKWEQNATFQLSYLILLISMYIKAKNVYCSKLAPN